MSICTDDDAEFFLVQSISKYLLTAPTPMGDTRRSVAHCLQAIHGEGVCMLPWQHEGPHRAYDRRIRLDGPRGGSDRRTAAE